MAHDGAAERHALALAAGELARLALEEFADAEDVGRLLDALADLGPGEFAHLEAEGHVVVHAHVRVERVVLEHHGDVAVHGRQVVDHLAVDEMSPELIASSPAIILSVVVLPQPDGPTNTTNSLSRICRLKSLTACTLS